MIQHNKSATDWIRSQRHVIHRSIRETKHLDDDAAGLQTQQRTAYCTNGNNAIINTTKVWTMIMIPHIHT